MDTFQAIKERRAVKYYDPTHQLTKAEVDKIIELAMDSPSSSNIQHWRIVNVVDKGLRTELRAAAYDQAQVTDASLIFVIAADVKAWKKNPEYFWRNTAKETQSFMVTMLTNFYQGKEQLQRDEAFRSIGIIMQTIMLAVKAMGYDSCPMIGFDTDKVAKIIKLPEDHVIGAMVTIGKATKPAWPKAGYIDKEVAFIENNF